MDSHRASESMAEKNEMKTFTYGFLIKHIIVRVEKHQVFCIKNPSENIPPSKNWGKVDLQAEQIPFETQANAYFLWTAAESFLELWLTQSQKVFWPLKKRVLKTMSRKK